MLLFGGNGATKYQNVFHYVSAAMEQIKPEIPRPHLT